VPATRNFGNGKPVELSRLRLLLARRGLRKDPTLELLLTDCWDSKLMGIDFTGLRALAFSKRVYGFDFRETVMLGRQEIHFWKEEYMAVRKNAKLDFEYDEAIELGQFAEPLFQKMGAQKVTSVDAAGYEGASVIHDFNLPLPENLFGAFDTFVDFGSIEHVFNVAQAIDNISSIVKVHGSILIVTIANGFSGHGFYQYSPEFFYSVFSERNGFGDTSVFLVDTSRPKTWHFIKSPARLKRRNQIPFGKQFWIAVFSRKYSDVKGLEVIQSDYENAKWTTANYAHFEPWNQEQILKSRKFARRILNPYVYKAIAYARQAHNALANYKKDCILMDPDTVDADAFMKEITAHSR
jgi:SAM-dependent methyltransferase